MPVDAAPARSKSTPLPRLQLTIISLVLLSESICATMLIPFVGLFVAFMQGWEVEKAGYASGFLIGLFMLGQVVSCKAWSALSEKHGRKVGIVIGVSGSAFATLFFGLSASIWTCSFWRFIHGLFNGSSLISKTVIADVTDKTNEAKGFMLISLTWGIGMLFGPAIGGFLYDPAHSAFGSALGVSSDGFLSRYPAFLPSFFTFLYNLVAAGAAIRFLEESNRDAKVIAESLPPSVSNQFQWLLDYVQPHIPAMDRDVVVVSTDREQPPPAAEVAATSEHASQKFGFKQAFQLELTKNVIIISMLISASDMIYAETFPLWGIAEKSVGGLGLQADMIGVLILVNSAPAVAANMAFPSAVKWFNDQLRFFRITEVMYALLSFLVAFAPYFEGMSSFWYAMFFGLIRKGWESWCWSLLIMVCAQAAPRGKVGMMYAVQQATACVVRCIVPFIGAPLFAWSIAGNHIFPFNHFLLFVLSVIPLIWSWYLTKKIFVPAEYELGQIPVPASEANAPEQIPAGFSTRSFLGSNDDNDSRAESEEDELDGSFSTLATSFAMAMGPGNLQPSVMVGLISDEAQPQEQEVQQRADA